MVTKNQKSLTAHIPTELADEVEAIAGELDRSKGWIVREAVAKYIIEHRKNTLDEEGLKDLEEGRFKTVDQAKAIIRASIRQRTET